MHAYALDLAYAYLARHDDVVVLSFEDLVLIFGISVVVVAGIAVFLARDIILKKRTDYDDAELGSKKDRDYEKYHSDWLDDYQSKEVKPPEYDLDTPDYYSVLGVPKDAAPHEIKARYRELAKQLHPDKNADADSRQRMAEINEAYETLSDEGRRRAYDRVRGFSGRQD